MNKQNLITAYKVFNSDWTCLDFQYEVGKSYHQEGEIIPCENGFHACKRAVDCFNYYVFNTSNRVAEVEVWGEVVYHEDKIVSSDITVVRELSWAEVFDLVNTGKGNTGQGNTGHRNTGSWNSGNGNSGDSNSGNLNTGHRNTGSWNSGNGNSGDSNTGHRNTGSWNSCNRSTGFFNSQTQESLVPVFNGTAYVSAAEFMAHPGYSALYTVPRLLTDEHGNAIPYKDACRDWWSKMPEEAKKLVQTLPGFRADVFEEITGIKV